MANIATVNRRLVIVMSVVLLHLGALWALQSGLLHRAAELIVPVQVLSQFIAPAPPPPPPPKPVAPVEKPKPIPTPPPKVLPVTPPPAPPATSTPAPTPALPAPAPPSSSPAGPTAPSAPTTASTTATAPAAAPAAPAPAPKLELPSSNAGYLNNPKPAYPALSKRLGEQGTVVVRVLIGADGIAQQAEISKSSGYPRLDQAAQAVVLKWRYVPGKRGGVAETMWFNVPISFVLE